MTYEIAGYVNDYISDEPEIDISQPWTEKYRPLKIDDIVDHEDIKKSLRNFINTKSLPHLILHGPPGSGKTSTIMCCANELYGDYVTCMVLRLNASNERGIETVRTTIKQFVNSKSNFFVPEKYKHLFKIVVLDEIDAMTIEAQGMLRQTIEKHSDGTRFCLICNDVDKINIALQSRCALFRFTPLKKINMCKRIKEIADNEHIKITSGAVDSIVNITKGDMRAAINMLQQISLSGIKKIDETCVYKFSGHCMTSVIDNIFVLLTKLSTNPKQKLDKTIYTICDTIIEYNLTIYNLLDELKKNIISSKTLSEENKLCIIDKLAETEKYDSVNMDTRIIVMYIASIFKSINIDKN